MAKPLRASRKPQGVANAGPLQVVAHNMARWVMMLGAGMGGVSVAAFYFGLLVQGAMLLSIFLVSVTLYFFIKLWPEEEARPKPDAAVAAPASAPKPGRAVVAAVQIGGPPKMRCMMALREMVRRQESFRISQQGAEAFAKTIRYMLRSRPSR